MTKQERQSFRDRFLLALERRLLVEIASGRRTLDEAAQCMRSARGLMHIVGCGEEDGAMEDEP